MGWKGCSLVQNFDIIIVGAGASGLMAASKYKDRSIAIIEGNEKIAEKIKISGGGKCNVTNESVTVNHYLGDDLFIAPILKAFDQNALLSFLKKRGCEPIVRKNQQYFCKESAKEIISLFAQEIKGIPLFLHHKVVQVDKLDEMFIVTTTKEKFCAKKLVFATGGLSYPKIGASGIALEVAKTFGHTINTTTPALVGFTIQKEQFWMKELSGISLVATIKTEKKSVEGELLFAHKGISGPVVLNASLYWQKGQLSIDFLPDISLRSRLKNSKKFLSTLLPLPKRFVKLFLLQIGVEDKAADQLSEDEIGKLLTLKAYQFAPAGNFGYTKAEVMRGGIATKEINPDTMMSLVVDNLYFLGEALDVTGELGGYNFQWAFSSAQRLTL
ncbi:MAG: aminoacetone oxidase family FAD-binding enzyme [Epsilonproteobacteria bacterium]|nr:aminoacetone oxidase family FAD-binding enzyme [Campylobacterota bacterium]